MRVSLKYVTAVSIAAGRVSPSSPRAFDCSCMRPPLRGVSGCGRKPLTDRVVFQVLDAVLYAAFCPCALCPLPSNLLFAGFAITLPRPLSSDSRIDSVQSFNV